MVWESPGKHASPTRPVHGITGLCEQARGLNGHNRTGSLRGVLCPRYAGLRACASVRAIASPAPNQAYGARLRMVRDASDTASNRPSAKLGKLARFQRLTRCYRTLSAALRPVQLNRTFQRLSAYGQTGQAGRGIGRQLSKPHLSVAQKMQGLRGISRRFTRDGWSKGAP